MDMALCPSSLDALEPDVTIFRQAGGRQTGSINLMGAMHRYRYLLTGAKGRPIKY